MTDKSNEFDFLCYYNEAVLGTVITITEAMLMWPHVTRNEIMMRMYEGRLSGRKSFTGGTILVSFTSMVINFGKPKNHTLYELYESKYKEDAK